MSDKHPDNKEANSKPAKIIINDNMSTEESPALDKIGIEDKAESQPA